MSKTIIIKMPPFPKPRPRVTQGGKHTYMPKNYMQRREELQWRWKEQGGELDISGPISMSVVFKFRMPKSWSKKKKAQYLGSYCLKKPDLDNCIGGVMDAILANDSNVICFYNCYKIWDEEDSIEITINSEQDNSPIPF